MSKVSVLMEGKKVAIVYWVIRESREGFGLPREREKKDIHFQEACCGGLAMVDCRTLCWRT